jgi:hypothetical protein
MSDDDTDFYAWTQQQAQALQAEEWDHEPMVVEYDGVHGALGLCSGSPTRTGHNTCAHHKATRMGALGRKPLSWSGHDMDAACGL